MIPCYQICKDRNCSHWNPELFDCDFLPADCDYAIDHLLADRKKQRLSRSRHGFWEEYFWIGLNKTGPVWRSGYYKEGFLHGLNQLFYMNGQLKEEGYYEDDKKVGIWRYWDGTGRLRKGKDFGNGELKQ